MTTFRELETRYLEQVPEGLKKIREAPPERRRDLIIALIAPIMLAHTERLKLRQLLVQEFGFPVSDFEAFYSSKHKGISIPMKG